MGNIKSRNPDTSRKGQLFLALVVIQITAQDAKGPCSTLQICIGKGRVTFLDSGCQFYRFACSLRMSIVPRWSDRTAPKGFSSSIGDSNEAVQASYQWHVVNSSSSRLVWASLVPPMTDENTKISTLILVRINSTAPYFVHGKGSSWEST